MLAVASGLIAFAFDLFFAISLQRFFVSIGLIQGGNETAWFGPLRSLAFETMMFVFAGVCRALITWLNSVATGISQVAFESSARRKISQWALWQGNTSTGRVSTLFNDIVLCSAAAMSTFHYFVGRVLMLVASLLTLLYYSPVLTGVVLLLLLLATPLHRHLDKRITRASGTIQQSLSGVSDRLMRGVKNSIFLHIHGILGPEVSGQNRLIGKYERSSRQYYVLASARGVLPQVLGILVVALIATQGSGVFSQNRGDLVAYLYLVMRFFQTLSDTARVTANIRGNWPRLNILANWYRDDYSPGKSRMDRDTAAGHEFAVRPDSVGFSLQDVNYSWSEGNPVLANVSIELPAGGITVILGPSGVGKTTLLLLLSRLVAPETGKVVAHFPDGSHDLGDVRQRVLSVTSYVGPDPFVIAGSVRDFLMFGQWQEVSDAEMLDALELAHCDFVQGLPGGLEYRIAEQGAGLSAGQKQRLSIARALLRKPRLLLLDEATSNLDNESERAIIDTVQSLRGSVTIVAVTHREAMKVAADTILTIEGNGQVTLFPQEASAGQQENS
jgi:ABC-type multidrug transport system fused ATPase/permease subunit